METKNLLLIIIIFLFGLGLVGCDASLELENVVLTDSSSNAANVVKKHSGIGKMKMFATRAPSATVAPSVDDLSSAVMVFDRIDVRSVEGVFYTYNISPLSLDLLKLKEGMGLTLSKLKLPMGEFDMIRLGAVGQGMLTFKDGHTSLFDIPSGEESGLKIFPDHPIGIFEDAFSVVVMEFDVEDSFVFTGNGGVHFKPVLRILVSDPIFLPDPVTITDSNDVETGPPSLDPITNPVTGSDSEPVLLTDPLVSPVDQNDPAYYDWILGS